MKFTIKQGEHYSNKRLWIWLNKRNNRKKIIYSVVLDENCWYNENVVSYSGWNKIFGFGAWYHHNDSARFVWKPDYENKGKLIIASYVYKNGDWSATEFSNIYVNNAKTMSIQSIKSPLPNSSGYLFKCGIDEIFIKHPNPVNDKKLWPYFGGYDRAYKDMNITLNKIIKE